MRAGPRTSQAAASWSRPPPKVREAVASAVVSASSLNHPVVGELSLDWDTLTASTDPGQQLVIWTAASGSPTRERLRILASWAADQHLSAAPTE
nr:hypothetical protein [Streptomyces tsukubensis]